MIVIYGFIKEWFCVEKIVFRFNIMVINKMMSVVRYY